MFFRIIIPNSTKNIWNRSIWIRKETLTDTPTPGQSESGSDVMMDTWYVNRITDASSAFGRFYKSAMKG